MKILVGPLPPPPDGQSISFELLIDGLRERGLVYKVVNLSGDASSVWGRALEYGFILADYFVKVAFGRKLVYITIAQSKRGFLRDLPMIMFARLLGHRVICHLHGGNYGSFFEAQPQWLKRLIRLALRQVDVMIVLGEGLRQMFDFEPQLADKIRVVPNGLPLQVQLDRTPKCLPTGSDEPVRLLYLSNLIESKGYFDLLEAVRILVDDYGLNVECHFCGLFKTNADDVRVKGTTHAQQLFADFVKAHQLDKHAIYRGSITGDIKLQALKQSHFLILTTNYDNEGQPVCIIEAMAFGAVAISTPYRAIPDLVVDGFTGCLVPYAQPGEIAKAIGSLCADPQRYSAMSQAALGRFHNHFTRGAHLEKLVGVLTETEGTRVGRDKPR